MMRAVLLGLLIALWCAPNLALRAADARPHAELAPKATWKAPLVDGVRAAALDWLSKSQADEATRAQIESLWTSAAPADAGTHLLDLVAATFSSGDPRARELVSRCSQSHAAGAPLPDVAWLGDEKTAPFERDNLRLFFGRWLVQESLYDEGLEQLGELKTADVVDPAALLFYQSVIHHRTLNRSAGLASIGRLLENETAVPKRYASLARLMQADLETLKDDSLDHIARRMDDIRRRLGLGRAGPKVRKVEDGVIA